MYRKVGKKIDSKRRIVKVNKMLFEELRKMSKNAFTMRCIAAIVNNGKGETLLIKQKHGKVWKNHWTVPWLVAQRGSDHAITLNKYLLEMNLNVQVKAIAGIERVMFKYESKQLRANFVVYKCVANNIPANHINDMIDAKWYKKIPSNTIFKKLLIK
jgi:adenine-specific DNA glycosylase